MSRASNAHQATPQTWVGRPFVALLVRVAVVMLPASLGIALSWWLSTSVPVPGPTIARVERLVLILGASTGVTFVVGRVARRMLPLAALLRLTLVFPDHVPSRFAVSLRRSSSRRLERDLVAQPITSDGRVAVELLRLVRALSEHHRPTRGHSERVRAYADLLGEQLGVSAEGRERLGWAALLHDIGKLTVPSSLLDKPSAPSDGEWAVLAEHPLRGGGIDPSVRHWLGEWWLGVVQHHERWDGTGYPFGLAGTNISLSARIIAVADSFETMTSVRAYKRAMSMQTARTELVRCAGSHFDPSIVRAMLDVNLGSMRSVSRLTFFAELPLASVAAQLGEAARASAAVATVAATTVLGPVTQSFSAPSPPPAHATVAATERNPGRNEVGVTPTHSTKARPPASTPRPGVARSAATSAPAAPGATAGVPTAVETTSAGPSPDTTKARAPGTTKPGRDATATTTVPSGPAASTPPVTVPVVSSRPTGPIADRGISIVQGQRVAIDVRDRDHGGGDVRSVEIVTPPTKGRASVVAGQLTYQPSGIAVGVDHFAYRLCRAASCSEGTVTVTIGYAPVLAVRDVVSLSNEGVGVVHPLANDFGQLVPATLSIVGAGSGVTAVVQPDGSVRLSKAKGTDAHGEPLRYQVCDVSGRCSRAEIAVAPR